MQSFAQYCPGCRAPVPANQSFCQHCGTLIDDKTVKAVNNRFTNIVSSSAPQGTSVSPQDGYPQSAPTRPAQAGSQPPVYARPQKRGRGLKRLGLGLMLLCLLLVAILGTAGVFAVRFLNSHLPGGAHLDQNVPGVQGPITTTLLNTTVTYASVTTTIINAQQAAKFLDDSEAVGLLRLNLHEQNTNTPEKSLVISTVSYAYADTFRLILPGGKSVAPLNSQRTSAPIQGEAQTGWVDFALPTTTRVNSLILRLGTETEAQIDVPLTSQPALSQYQPKQISVGRQVHYGPLSVTLVSATSQLSYGGQQASKGMRFLITTLSFANLTANDVAANPLDYIRLQATETTATPQGNTTVPTTLAAQTSNTKGEAAFQVPQNETAFTLLLLSNDAVGATNQATLVFQTQ